MPYRKIPLVVGEIYHVFNRSVARKPIFLSQRDYERITKLIHFYRFQKPPIRFSYFNRLPKDQKNLFIELHMKKRQPMLDIISYCLMPNHVHFLLKPHNDKAISDFMRKIQNSYSKYFNTKNNRSGSLFQSMFKAVRIETDEQLLHVSRYIHLNPVSSAIIRFEELEKYPWSSFGEYLTDNISDSIIKKGIVLQHFSSQKKYKLFVFDQADYQRELENIKHLIIDD